MGDLDTSTITAPFAHPTFPVSIRVPEQLPLHPTSSPSSVVRHPRPALHFFGNRPLHRRRKTTHPCGRAAVSSFQLQGHFADLAVVRLSHRVSTSLGSQLSFESVGATTSGVGGAGPLNSNHLDMPNPLRLGRSVNRKNRSVGRHGGLCNGFGSLTVHHGDDLHAQLACPFITILARCFDRYIVCWRFTTLASTMGTGMGTSSDAAGSSLPAAVRTTSGAGTAKSCATSSLSSAETGTTSASDPDLDATSTTLSSGNAPAGCGAPVLVKGSGSAAGDA
ncbi:hypothetical protein D9619_009334 [Psilocybe cf. subviscida]|uniref:Uncharacterized protein n=1 Tax=Psilocybe cf. subviscida TaxID=2480587 RepID=A0A8H5BWS9_9AGAR|nr:hypothetical protein D9619_009334 [Psilocybe cf. subviscida]